MTRGRLAIHAHFYQPERRDPFTNTLPPDPGAAPFRDWNDRIDAECYRPNADRGNLERISFDLGPTLAEWLATHDPSTHAKFIAADRPPTTLGSGPATGGTPGAATIGARNRGGNAIAQAFHHSILPLASLRDRRTEIRWGLRDFLLRFGRPARGIWLPETAVDLPTLRAAAEEGITFTILAPWQTPDPDLDTRRPYRVELGGGYAITVAFYDAGLAGRASFDPETTADADRFARDLVAPRLASARFRDGATPLVVVATDGELYGHHQKFRDLFLERLVTPSPSSDDRGFDVVSLGDVLDDPDAREFPAARIQERTSWSCHHGVARWTAECPDAADGRWKGPLRAAMERLAAAIDVTVEGVAAGLRGAVGAVDVWAARDAYIDVVVGAEPPGAFSARWLGEGAPPDDRHILLRLLEAERWRLAMFGSDGWFWDDPVRPETKHVLLAAARAVRLVDEVAGTALETRFVEDLTIFVSPSRRIDGAAIYREALATAGQPLP